MSPFSKPVLVLSAAALAAAFGSAAGQAARASRTPASSGKPIALATPSRQRPITVPPLTGAMPVGTTTLHLVDRRRPDKSFRSGKRELMVQLWYPASSASGPLAPYMPARTAAALERASGAPAGTVSDVRTHAHSDAPIATGLHPIVLFSPGSTQMRSDATAVAEDLASNGYIVVAIDHTHESELVQFPNGQIVRGGFTDTGPASNLRALQPRIADARFVLDQLQLIERSGRFAHHLNLAEEGMLGFSLGGATAAATMLADPRLKAGADLDGSIYGPVLHRGLSRPFLLLVEPRVFRHDPTIAGFYARLRGPHLAIGLRGSAHQTFEDIAWVKPQLAQRDPTVARAIGDTGTIAPLKAMRLEADFVQAFFDRYLRHRQAPLISTRASYSEVG